MKRVVLALGVVALLAACSGEAPEVAAPEATGSTTDPVATFLATARAMADTLEVAWDVSDDEAVALGERACEALDERGGVVDQGALTATAFLIESDLQRGDSLTVATTVAATRALCTEHDVTP